MSDSYAEDVRNTILGRVTPGGQVTNWEQVVEPKAFGDEISSSDPRNLQRVARIASGTALALEELAHRLDKERSGVQP